VSPVSVEIDALSGADAGVVYGAPALHEAPDPAKITEYLAFADVLGPYKTPFSPLKPNIPRGSLIQPYW
jgi:hypothetical protein